MRKRRSCICVMQHALRSQAAGGATYCRLDLRHNHVRSVSQHPMTKQKHTYVTVLQPL
jgi:hypothetical protein